MTQLVSTTLPGSNATLMIDDAANQPRDFGSRVNSVTINGTPNTEDDTGLDETITRTKGHSITYSLDIEFKGSNDNYDFVNEWCTTLNEGRDVQFRPGGAGSGRPEWNVIAHSGSVPNTAARESLQAFSVSFLCNPPASGGVYSSQ